MKTNILFIFADDWGYGDLGCMGHQELKTPNLDKLADEGTIFTQFHVASPVCSPSRCAVLTGQYPSRHMVHGHFADYKTNENRNMQNWLTPNVQTLPGLLREAGCKTAHYGKWHLGGGGGMYGHPQAPRPKEYGYDETRVWNGNGPTWCGTKPWPFELHNDLDEEFLPHSDRLAVEEAIKFIESDEEKPFFINLWIRAPHTPLRATPEQRQQYLHVDEPKQTYYSVLSEADRQIGIILDKLDELGLTQKTLVIFSSDNGPESPNKRNHEETKFCQGSTGGLRGRKRSLYEGGVRVPFIVRWPDVVTKGRVDLTSQISAVDLLPTFCCIAERNCDDLNLDGINIIDALTNKGFKRNKPLMWEWRQANLGKDSKESPMHAIRDGDYVLLKNPSQNRIELYNTSTDHAQIKNLSHENHELVGRLCRQLDEWTSYLPDKESRPCSI